MTKGLSPLCVTAGKKWGEGELWHICMNDKLLTWNSLAKDQKKTTNKQNQNTPNFSKSYRCNKSSTVIKGLSASSAAIKGHTDTQESHLYFSLKKKNSSGNMQFLLSLFSGFFLHFTQTFSPPIYICINTSLWVKPKIQQQGIPNHIPSHVPLHPALQTCGYSSALTVDQKNLAELLAGVEGDGGRCPTLSSSTSGKDKALLPPQTFRSHPEITLPRCPLPCETATFI